MEHYTGAGRPPALVAYRKSKRALAKKREAKLDAMIAAEESQPNADTAFARLINAFSVAGSYPEKQRAMSKAVESLGAEATADDLYSAAVGFLGVK